MVSIHLVPNDLRALYEVHEWRNAAAVLQAAHPEEWADIIAVLRSFKLSKSDVAAAGDVNRRLQRESISAPLRYNR
ncbi:MAG: hypothetical protein LC808_28550 [Actinobacteria bacterium]|nr:hypothetical protein [Actinomycetota bacterium]